MRDDWGSTEQEVPDGQLQGAIARCLSVRT